MATTTALRTTGFEGSSSSPEKRRSHRRSVIELQLVPVDLGNENGGVVLDLSESGIGLQAVAQPSTGAVIHLRFDLPSSGNTIDADAQVVWAQGGTTGLRIVKLGGISKTHFDDWLTFYDSGRFRNSSSEVHDDAVVLDFPSSSPEISLEKEKSSQTSLEISAGGFFEECSEALQRLAEQALKETDADGAAIAFREGDGAVGRASAGTGPGVGARFHLNSGLSGECVRTGKIVHCDDTQLDLRVDPVICRQLELRSVVIVPINHGGRVVGILEVLSGKPYAFDDSDILILSGIAESVASIVEGTHRGESQDDSLPPITELPRSNQEDVLFKDRGPAEEKRMQSSSIEQVSLGSGLVSSEAPIPVSSVTISDFLPQSTELAEADPLSEEAPTFASSVVSPDFAPEGTQSPAGKLVLDAAVPTSACSVSSDFVPERIEPTEANPVPGDAAPLAPSLVSPVSVPDRKEIVRPQPHFSRARLLPFANLIRKRRGRFAVLVVALLCFFAFVAGLLLAIFQHRNTKESLPQASTSAQVLAKDNNEPAQPQAIEAVPNPTSRSNMKGQSREFAEIQVASETVSKLAKTPVLLRSAIAQPEPPALDQTAPGSSSRINNGIVSVLGTLPIQQPTLASAGNLATSQLSGGIPIYKVQPAYPAVAKSLMIQGDVQLEALIGRDGSVKNVRYVKGLIFLGEAAISAVKQWKYDPFKLNGQPIEQETSITIKFRR
jgi:TonB family protein